MPMPPYFTIVATRWQNTLPPLAIVGAILWFTSFWGEPHGEPALFAALLIIYFIHQIEEYLWPGGFRAFVNARTFHSGRDDWPVTAGGTAFVNIVLVWVPIALAIALPDTLRWVGLAWIGLTLVNGVIHIVGTIVLRAYNPGVVTGVVLFLPYTITVLAFEHRHGLLTTTEIAAVIVLGIVLHIPVAALFAVPYLRRRAA
jgi:hypothetical protein